MAEIVLTFRYLNGNTVVCSFASQEKVGDVRRKAAVDSSVSAFDSVNLIHNGVVLNDDDELLFARFASEDQILVSPTRKPPAVRWANQDAMTTSTAASEGMRGRGLRLRIPWANRLRGRHPPRPGLAHEEGSEEGDEGAGHILGQPPPGVSDRQRRVGKWLQRRLRFPDVLMECFYMASLRRWTVYLAWLAVAPAMSRIGLGGPFVMLSILGLILNNLGTRRDGELSAYSIFNPHQERLPGDMSGDQVDRGLRGWMW